MKGAPFSAISPVRISFNGTQEGRPGSRGSSRGLSDGAASVSIDDAAGDDAIDDAGTGAGQSWLLTLLQRGVATGSDKIGGLSGSRASAAAAVDAASSSASASAADATDMSFREQCGKVLCELSKPSSARLQIIRQVCVHLFTW